MRIFKQNGALDKFIKNPSFDEIVCYVEDNGISSDDIMAFINFLLTNKNIKLARRLFDYFKIKLEEDSYIDSMYLNIMLYLSDDDEEGAHLAKEEYLNAPYISQEVEEHLGTLDAFIEKFKEILGSINLLIDDNVDINKTKEYLASKSLQKVLDGIYLANKAKDEGIDLSGYILNIVKKTTEYSLKYALLIRFLLENNISSDLCVFKFDQEIEFNLDNIRDLFFNAKKEIKDTITNLEPLVKDVQVFKTVSIFIDKLFLFLIPDCLEEFDVNAFILAIYYRVISMFKFEPDKIIEDNLYIDSNKKLDFYTDLINASINSYIIEFSEIDKNSSFEEIDA